MKTFKEFVEEALKEPTVNRYNSNWWIALGEKYGDYRAGAEPDFKIGDKVIASVDSYRFKGELIKIDLNDSRLPYLVRDDKDGFGFWVGKDAIKKL